MLIGVYDYIFYSLFKLLDKGWGGVLTNWRASLSLGVIEVFLMMIIYALLHVWLEKNGTFYAPRAIIFSVTTFIVSIHYLAFYRNDRWKLIIKKYDQQPRKKNIFTRSIVYFFISLIVFGLYKSLNLYGKMINSL